MVYAPGQSGNPNGRPKGARNKRTNDFFETLEARGDKDCAEYLSEVVTNSKDETLRLQAAGLLLPYKYSKVASTPPPRYIEEPIAAPEFLTVEDAERFLAAITQKYALGEISSQSAELLLNTTKAWLDVKYDRDKQRFAEANANYQPGTREIVIRGGLPVMPGLESVVMPKLNGHQVTDSALPWAPGSNESFTAANEQIPAPSPALGELSATIDHEPSSEALENAEPQSEAPEPVPNPTQV